jgi:transposase
MPTPRIPLSRVRRLAVLCASTRLPPLSFIAKKLDIARATVWNYQRGIRASGYSFTDFAALNPSEMLAALGGHIQGRGLRYALLVAMFSQSQTRVYDGAVSLKQIWTQYRAQHPEGYGYTQFAAHFHAWREVHKLPTPRRGQWRVSHVLDEDLPELQRWRRSNDRSQWAKAAVVLESHHGAGLSSLCAKVERSPRIVKGWIRNYVQQGLNGLRPSEKHTTIRRQIEEKGSRYAALLTIFPQIQARLYDGTTDLKHIWTEYKSQHPEGYGYTQFGKHFCEWPNRKALPVTTRRVWRVPDISARDLPVLQKWRRSNNRSRWAKAVVVLESHHGVSPTNLCAKVKRCPRIVKRWIRTYTDQGLDGLRAKQKKHQGPEILAGMKQKRDRIIELLHETPRIHGINRASWSLASLAVAYEKQYVSPLVGAHFRSM